MKVVIQRCNSANVKVSNKIIGKIEKGYVLLVGFEKNDTKDIVLKMVNKIANLRIFSDENDKMNLSIKDVDGQILSVSQFTLYSHISGRRPSFINAMNYNDAKDMYDFFNKNLEKEVHVEKGEFGADMKVSLINDGPVTIIIDSEVDL